MKLLMIVTRMVMMIVTRMVMMIVMTMSQVWAPLWSSVAPTQHQRCTKPQMSGAIVSATQLYA